MIVLTVPGPGQALGQAGPNPGSSVGARLGVLKSQGRPKPGRHITIGGKGGPVMCKSRERERDKHLYPAGSKLCTCAALQ